MTSDLLRVRDLKVSFATDGGTAQVLDHVNLTIGRGQIVGLVGESGCGKTTLARSILGVLPKNSARLEAGTIEFDGVDLLTVDPNRLAATVRGRRISFIPQDPFSSFNPVFTIGAQIMDLMKWKSPELDDADAGRSGWLPRLHGSRRYKADRERVLDLLRQVQLPDPEGVLKKYPHEVSGGQRQRLMIAMALLPEPKLIIADEPTTALDVTIQAQILKLLRDLATDHGISVLFTTHDLGTAWEICDSITVMYAGQEMEAASSEGFFKRPSHPYTNRLLKSLPSRGGSLSGIPGSIPALVDPPTGCRFNPRCEFATDICRQTRPEVTSAGPGHDVRCYHPVAEEKRHALA
ncbi:ABC transporter ATP-binding protein [Thalassobaculum salexigens]|uniref:ABC transporter ATP-binding protein n=1 Tax=Thalassobaculum salexigens TaxID=455360 RepID=UPI00248DD8C0|nr:ABC transporter ATP-binding protein [Thalassobaculum salexigens]